MFVCTGGRALNGAVLARHSCGLTCARVSESAERMGLIADRRHVARADLSDAIDGTETNVQLPRNTIHPVETAKTDAFIEALLLLS